MKKSFLGLVLTLFASLVLAQSNTVGYIYGTVVDDSGQPVGEAVVIIKNPATGFKREVKVKNDGSFRVPSLPVGKYDIVITAPGQKDFTIEGLTVNVGTGTNASAVLGDEGATKLDNVVAYGGKISPIDVSSVESTTVFDEDTYDRLPVSRDLTSVALLAPGTVVGDGAFGNLASFGGASVGENAYFINGMDVTNFRNGLGGSTVPFEFYKEFQVKTGGYGVEFGRSTGGVVNAVTKSGTNEWQFGAGIYYTPNKFRKTDPDVYRQDGELFDFNSQNERDSLTAYVEAGGPIIKDKLFVYALYEARDLETKTVGNQGTRLYDAKQNDPFWGLKLDWNITDNHKLELTAWSDKRQTDTTTFLYDIDTKQPGEQVGTSTSYAGGKNGLLKYTGYLTPDFTLSAMVGVNKYDRTSGSPLDSNPVIGDSRQGGFIPLGNWVNFAPTTAFDKRKQARVDAEWAALENHTFRFGIDYQKNNSYNLQQYSGGVYYRYFLDDRSGTGESVRVRVFQNGGSFDVISSAIYVEDTWQLNDNMTLVLGLRNEAFDNKNSIGDSFIKITNQIAPRLGFTWDVNGDGTSKVFATLGRYHLPIASNTNVRLAGAELFTQDYYELLGLNADDTPIIGDLIEHAVFGDGTIPDPDAIRDLNIDPMYQDELIIGYEREWFDGFRGGVRYIYRDLKSTIEDVAIDAAVIQWAGDRLTLDGQTAEEVWGGFHQYVLTNPGEDMRIFLPEYGEYADLSAEMLGYPKSKRTYKAVEFFFEKVWDGQYYLQGSYTYSKSYGNNEGYVRSDNGQDDAGLTTLFDQPGLLDGAYGPLPNDRTHVVKLFGAWEFIPDWQMGFNVLMQTGRPINAFGIHPTDPFAALYGAESFYQNGQLVPRGTRGRTPFVTNVDLSLQYTQHLNWRNAQAIYRIDVFNLFNAHNVTEVVETAEQESGVPDPNYLLPTNFQDPQAVRFSARIEF